MSTYVVSPSASGIGSHERFLSVIEQEHIAIIGYAPDDGKADSFYAIKDGDLVIIARGANRNKECFFAGLADGDGWFVRVVKGEDYPEKYARKLRGFVDLRGLKVPFTTKCKGGESRNPHRTCTEIGGTDADDAVVKFVAALVEKTLFRESIMRYIEVLKRSKNLIFSGAPGTGKTYLARQIAQKMILGRVVDDETKLSNEECAKLADQMGFVQFHPSYDYTDFVEGLRPVRSEDGKTLGFERQDGVFKKFCWRAAQTTDSNFDVVYEKFFGDLSENYSEENPLELKTDGQGAPFYVCPNSRGSLNLLTGPDRKKQGSLTPGKIETYLTDSPYKWWAGYYRGVLNHLKGKYGLSTEKRKGERPYVFIIDEINRGDISKIFGELFFAIDKGYRGKTAGAPRTQYDNLIEPDDPFYGGFYVPENVYIIGTMNDIDRNVETMDFAIRRRFTWLEIMPNEDRLKAMLSGLEGVDLDEAARRMASLNAAIADRKNGLGKAYQIGPAYFRELESYKADADGGFGSLWAHHLAPLIREYLRGVPKADEMFDLFKSAYEQKPRVPDEDDQTAVR